MFSKLIHCCCCKLLKLRQQCTANCKNQEILQDVTSRHPISGKLKSPVETFVLRIHITHLHSSPSLFDAYSDLNKWVCLSIPPTISIKLLKYWHRVLFHSLVCSLIHLYHSLICLPCKARFTRALRCTHSLARSHTRSFSCSRSHEFNASSS